MPNFNKGTFEGVQYEAIPLGNLEYFQVSFVGIVLMPQETT